MPWESGDPLSIFRRYGNRGTAPTFGGFPISGLPNESYQTPSFQSQMPPSPGVPRTPTPTPSSIPMNNAASLVPDAGTAGAMTSAATTPGSIIGSVGSQIGGGMPGATPRAPSENSMQRAQGEAEQQNQGMRGISNQRRYFWATGRVDARPTQNPNNTASQYIPNPQWDEFFGPNATHLGSPGTTWEARQNRNQSNIAAARELRGLSPY